MIEIKVGDGGNVQVTDKPIYNTLVMGDMVQQTCCPGKDNNAQRNDYECSDTLIRFVFDDKEREKVIRGLQACEDTGQVAAFAKVLWEEETIKYDVLRSTGFHRAIIPLLSFQTTETALKQAIFKQVKIKE